MPGAGSLDRAWFARLPGADGAFQQRAELTEPAPDLFAQPVNRAR